jgi:hypothetical protein
MPDKGRSFMICSRGSVTVNVSRAGAANLDVLQARSPVKSNNLLTK